MINAIHVKEQKFSKNKFDVIGCLHPEEQSTRIATSIKSVLSLLCLQLEIPTPLCPMVHIVCTLTPVFIYFVFNLFICLPLLLDLSFLKERTRLCDLSGFYLLKLSNVKPRILASLTKIPVKISPEGKELDFSVFIFLLPWVHNNYLYIVFHYT